MPLLYILCGPSGAGKSTWARQFVATQEAAGEELRYVSRDEIRYSMLNEEDDYFAREKEVFKKFAGAIAQTLVDGFNVIADATHLTKKSRRKLIDAIDRYTTDYKIIMVPFDTDVEVCLLHNGVRQGRMRVPGGTIRNMCEQFEFPEYEEDKRIVRIWE